MANAVKGEVALSAFGVDYTFVLDLNALCEAEEYVPGIMDGADIKSMRAIRAVFWSGFIAHHPEVTLKDAGRIAQEVGIAEVGRLVKEGVKRSFGEGKGSRPPVPGKLGTGKGS